MSQLALSALFEYLRRPCGYERVIRHFVKCRYTPSYPKVGCYGSTTIINIFILQTKVDPRTERVEVLFTSIVVLVFLFVL